MPPFRRIFLSVGSLVSSRAQIFFGGEPLVLLDKAGSGYSAMVSLDEGP